MKTWRMKKGTDDQYILGYDQDNEFIECIAICCPNYWDTHKMAMFLKNMLNSYERNIKEP